MNDATLAELAYLAGEPSPDAGRIAELLARLEPRPGMGRAILLGGRAWWLDASGEALSIEVRTPDRWRETA